MKRVTLGIGRKAKLVALGLPLYLATVAVAQPTTMPADEAQDESLKEGITFRIYQIDLDLEKIPTLVDGQTPNFDELRPAVNFEGDDFQGIGPSLLSTATGFLKIDEPGEYVLQLESDDGSRALLDGSIVVDHDGTHGVTAKQSQPLSLEAGLHELRVEHFDHAGGRELRLSWKKPGSDEFELVPSSALLTEADPTRVTSPGPKNIVYDTLPGDKRPLESVHPGWEVTTIRPEGFQPMVGAMTFLPDGRLIVGTFAPLQRDEQTLPDIDSKEPDKLHALTGVDGDPANITAEIVADGLYEPMGACVVDGELYVAHRKAITKLTDTDGDGFFETHEDVAGGWEGWNYHQFAMGLEEKDGKLYTALSTSMAPPGWEGMGTNAGPNGPMRGALVEVDLSSHNARVVAGGFRTPNGLGIGPDGNIFYLDNQGTWMSTSQLAEVLPGRFYGHYSRTNFVPKLADRYPDGGYPSALMDRPRTPAAVEFVQNEVSNSPTQLQMIKDGPYAGQMLVGELTGGGVRRVFLEKINGQWQGAIFRFTQGLESGVNRMVFGPDGSLYVGGIGALGNWNWKQTKFGLQRLSPTGEDVFEIESVSATHDGFLVTFTKPVDTDWLADTENYEAKDWYYTHTAEYGGPKRDTRDLTVSKAEPFGDGRSVRLVIDDLKPGRVVYLHTNPKSEGDVDIWSTEAWYTLNAIPPREPAKKATLAGMDIDPSEQGVGVGVFPPAGAVPLLNASADVHFKPRDGLNENQGRTPEQIMEMPGYDEMGRGSLESRAVFGDARYHLEFYSPAGGEGQMAGNSGVYLQNLYELQILNSGPDAELAPDGVGAIYKKKLPDVNAALGADQWQAYDIWMRAARFENGKKTANARVTVYLNGQLIHDDVEIDGATGWRGDNPEPGTTAEGSNIQVGPLFLDDHGSDANGPVRFRNIWVTSLDAADYDAGDWQTLLDGDSMDGWQIRGGQATYDLKDTEDGTVVVGTTAPNTPNTFLTSEKEYGDFELIYEARVDPNLNSGVQIRSAVRGGYDQRDGALVGYQIELDPSDRLYTAGIYDEQRRGWLHSLIDAPYARRAFKPGDWNEIRVVATGPTVRTWINGVPAAEIFDAMDAKGHIGLQVHGVGDNSDPMTVEWRNLRIRELSAK